MCPVRATIESLQVGGGNFEVYFVVLWKEGGDHQHRRRVGQVFTVLVYWFRHRWIVWLVGQGVPHKPIETDVP